MKTLYEDAFEILKFDLGVSESPISDLEKTIKEAGWKVSGLGKNSQTRDAFLNIADFDISCTLTTGEKTKKNLVNSYVDTDDGTLKRQEKFSTENSLDGLEKLKNEIKNFKKVEDFKSAGWK